MRHIVQLALLICIPLLYSSAQAQTHVIYLKGGASVAGTPAPGKSEDEVVVTLQDQSKIVITLSDVKEIAQFNGQDLTRTLTEDGPIPPPRNLGVSILGGTQVLGSSTYELTQASGFSSANDSSNPGFGFEVEANYRPERYRFGASLAYSNFSYEYPSGKTADSLSSVLVIPKYFHDLSEKLTLGAGLGLGLITLDLGSSTTNASGTTISLQDSKTSFGLSPRIFAEYTLNGRFRIIGEASYSVFSGNFSGTIASPGITNALVESISRRWLALCAGILFRF
jgi:hypothetical protein